MDSHSRSASPREPMRPQHRPPSPPSPPAAFDNRAYQHDESDPNHNDSFTSNGPQQNGSQQNGHSKEPNGDTKTLEAVNLELINLTPKNGSTKQKKDVEVDMNASNPYDEYFVPVNEHRKYMRGEKLYVTADKRGEKAGCKRPLCWTLLVLVVAAIVALIVLAATGVLFSNSPTTLEQYNTSITSARALGGIGQVHDHDHDHDHHDHQHDHDHEQHDHEDNTELPIQPQHGPDTQSDEGRDESIGSAEADSSMYVPRTVEGELKIDNEEFTMALQDPESNEYREFVTTFSDGLKRALFNRDSLEKGGNEISVEVVQLRKGSVIVNYRIHWKTKQNSEPTEDLLNANTLKMNLDDYLSRNNRMINVYHVADEQMATRLVLDICQINKNDCEYGCQFNEDTLDFTCTCPHGQMLDITNPKRCMSILENTYQTEPREDTNQKDLKLDSNPSTMKPMPEEETPVTVSVHVHENEHRYDWKETNQLMPKTTTEIDTDLNFSHIFGHPIETHQDHETEPPVPEPNSDKVNSSPEPEPELKSEPEPTAEPRPIEAPESSHELEVQPVAEHTADSEVEPPAEPAAEPAAEPTAEPAAEPTAELAAEPTAEPTAEPIAEPATEATAEPEAEPTAESVTEPTAEPTAEPAAEPTAEPAAEPTSGPAKKLEADSTVVSEAKPETETTAEPAPEPEPTSGPEAAFEPKSSTEQHQNKVESSESPSEPEPTPEPQSDSEYQSMLKTSKVSMDDEHNSETETLYSTEHLPVLESELTEKRSNHMKQSEEKSILYTNEGKYEFKSSSEMDTPMETTTVRISISEPNIINEPSYEPKPEIISILSDQSEYKSNPKFITSEHSETTTDSNDWLEHKTEINIKEPAELEDKSESGEKKMNDSYTQTYTDLVTNNVDRENHETEQRSFKSSDDDFVRETSTTKIVGEDGFTTEHNTEEIEKVQDEIHITPSILLSTSTDKPEEQSSKNDSTETSIYSVIMENSPSEPTTINTNSEILKNDDTKLDSQNNIESRDEVSTITSVVEESKSLDSNKTDTTTTKTEPEIVREYSILKQYQDPQEDKTLMEALEKKNPSKNMETSTENNTPSEGMDITFDTINMLYNRSSKSIENQNDSIHSVTESNVIAKDTSETTESDWLFEPVTEINYQKAVTKMDEYQTESSVSKIDDVINRGNTKEDFEPEYLNNMDSNNKMTERDEPMYSMSHDYDNEDSRVKRVNFDKDGKDKTIKEITGEVSVKEIVTEANPASKPAETTTVTEYIYKSAEKSMNKPVTILQNEDNLTTTNPSSGVGNPEPAPVWEETEAVKDLSPKESNEQVTTNHAVVIDELLPSTTTTTTEALTTTTVASLRDSPFASVTTVLTTSTPTTTTSASSQEILSYTEDNVSQVQNTTQVNNLNVTIYEISSHSDNNSIAVTKPTVQSVEVEDHETEMNPFLPVEENNKILVKKLQEGHDLEPNNLNETQNENIEEHALNSSEGQISMNNDATTVIPKELDDKTSSAMPTTTEEYTNFNELLMNVSPHKNDSEVTKESTNNTTAVVGIQKTSDETNVMSKSEEKDLLKISSFLRDTDDLDNAKEHTTEHISTMVENKLQNDAISPSTSSGAESNNDSEFLSVVPITQERIEEKEALKKSYRSENIQELNDISDLPNSDKRTLDTTNFDSVINNEA